MYKCKWYTRRCIALCNVPGPYVCNLKQLLRVLQWSSIFLIEDPFT